MPTPPRPTPLADTLREATRQSGLSYSRLAQLAKLDSGTISHFMTGDRDMTLGVASRLCAVLGYGLAKVAEAAAEPLADPPKTNRDPKGQAPASALKRGRGRRVDLEVAGGTLPAITEMRSEQSSKAKSKLSEEPPPQGSRSSGKQPHRKK